MLIYLININEEEKHNRISDFIKNKKIIISIQNLKEFSNVMFNKTNLSSEDIREKIIFFGRKFILVPELPTDIITAIELTKNRKTFYDALIIATMMRNNITNIITENEKDFGEFEGIKTINPFK